MQTISPAIGVAGANSYYKDEYQIDENQSDIAQDNGKPSVSGKALSSSSGRWHGELAKDFGLEGAVKPDEFLRLTEGQHPATGEQLVRQVKSRPKKNRDGEIIKDKNDKPKMTSPRRAGNDLTLSAPKSVSIVAVVGKDERIAVVHRKAVNKTFDEIEKFVEARMGNTKPAERTRKAVWAIFSHDLARPDEATNFAAPDLHDHGFLFNSTKTKDGKYRAIQPYELFCSQQFATAIYRSELAIGLKKIGYEIRIDEKTNAPEIVGISRDYIEANSPRQTEVKARAKELGSNSTKKVAHLSRQKKNFNREEMKRRHLELDEKFGFQAQKAVTQAKASSTELQRQDVTREESKDETIQNAKKAVNHAICVAKEKPELHNWRTLVTTALNQKMGETTFDEIKNEIEIQHKTGAFKDFDLGKKISRKARRQQENIIVSDEKSAEVKLDIETSILPKKEESDSNTPRKSLETTNNKSTEKIKEVTDERIIGRTNSTQHRKTSAEQPVTTPAWNNPLAREPNPGNYSDSGAKIVEYPTSFIKYEKYSDHEEFAENERSGKSIFGKLSKGEAGRDQHPKIEFRIGIIINNNEQPTIDERATINKRSTIESEKSNFAQRSTVGQHPKNSESNSHKSRKGDSADWQQPTANEPEYAVSQRRSAEDDSKNGYFFGVQEKENSETTATNSEPSNASQISGAGKGEATTGRGRQDNQRSETAERASNEFAATGKKTEKAELDEFRDGGISKVSDDEGNERNILPNKPKLSGKNTRSGQIGVGTYFKTGGIEPEQSDKCKIDEDQGGNQRAEEMEKVFDNFVVNNLPGLNNFADLEFSYTNFDNNELLPATDVFSGNNLDVSANNAGFVGDYRSSDGSLRNVFTEPLLQPAQNIMPESPNNIDPVRDQFSGLDDSLQQQLWSLGNIGDFVNNNNFSTSDALSEIDSLSVSEVTAFEPLEEREKEYIREKVTINLHDEEREEQEEEKAKIIEKSKEHEEFEERFVLSM